MQAAGPGELAGTIERLVRAMRRAGTAGHLSPSAAAVLAWLVAQGPHRLTELAGAVGMSQAGATQIVARLERDGLARRTRDESDRRGVLVAVTAAGRHVVERRRAERADGLRQLMSRLEPADQAAITLALPALDRLVRLSEDAPARSPRRRRIAMTV